MKGGKCFISFHPAKDFKFISNSNTSFVYSGYLNNISIVVIHFEFANFVFAPLCSVLQINNIWWQGKATLRQKESIFLEEKITSFTWWP